MRNRWTTRLGAAALVGLAASALAACGEGTTASPGSESAAGTTSPSDRPPGELVVRVDIGGGFVPIEVNLSHLPQLSVYSDGLVLQPAPMIMIYPGPALAGLNASTLTEEGLDELEEAVVQSGLVSDAPDYGQPPVADAPTTTVTVTVDGQTFVHAAYGLGFEGDIGGLPGLTDEQLEARRRLSAFVDAVGDLPRLVGVGNVSEPAPWVPERYRLWASPATDVPPGTPAQPAPEPPPTTAPVGTTGTTGDPDAPVSSPAQADGGASSSSGVLSPPTEPTPPQEPQPRLWAWPIEAVDLASVEGCTAVEGEVAQAVGALFGQADQLTRFEQGGVAYHVVVRPVLPDEPGCPER